MLSTPSPNGQAVCQEIYKILTNIMQSLASDLSCPEYPLPPHTHTQTLTHTHTPVPKMKSCGTGTG